MLHGRSEFRLLTEFVCKLISTTRIVTRKKKNLHLEGSKKRGRVAAGKEKDSESSESFNTLLKRSIQEGMASVVGFEFYLDPAIAAKDIARYTLILEKMFTLGSKLIEVRCAEVLYRNLSPSFEKRDDHDLTKYFEDAKKKWLLGESRER
jgi:hypothetical protein